MSGRSSEGGALWWRLGRWWLASKWQGGLYPAMMPGKRGARQWGGTVRQPTHGGCAHSCLACTHIVVMKHIDEKAVQVSSKCLYRAHGKSV